MAFRDFTNISYRVAHRRGLRLTVWRARSGAPEPSVQDVLCAGTVLGASRSAHALAAVREADSPTHARVPQAPAAGGHAAGLRPAADWLGRRDGGPDQPLLSPGLLATSPPTWRATARPRCGAASTTAAKRSGSPSARPCQTDDGFELRGGRPAADVAARRDDRRDDPHDGARRRGVHAAARSSSRSIPAPGRSRCAGAIDGRRLSLEVKTPSGTRSEVRELTEPPALSLNMSRRLANGGLVPGAQLSMDGLRSGDAAQLAGQRRASASASWCAAPARRRFRRFASRWSSPACGRRRG